MKLRKPDYFDQFHCIGSACSDTCCAGWEIEVDEETSGRYQKLQGELGERIRRHLTVTEEESYFGLKNGRCPFLNPNGLCDIIIEAGEEQICDICREHPRFYNWYGTDTEVGLGMCCEEAQRLMFASDSPARFVVEGAGSSPETDGEREAGSSPAADGERGAENAPQTDGAWDLENGEEEQFVALLAGAREVLFGLAQNRKKAFADRIEDCLAFGDCLQDALDLDDSEALERISKGEWKQFCTSGSLVFDAPVSDGEAKEQRAEVLADIDSLLTFYLGLEALTGQWPDWLRGVKERLGEILDSAERFSDTVSQTSWEYEHLLVYFLNRYFLEVVYDMDAVSKIRFAVCALIVIRVLEIGNWLQTGVRSEKDRNDVIRCYSKEIEYCPENVASLVENCWIREEMQTEALKEMAKFLL